MQKNNNLKKYKKKKQKTKKKTNKEEIYIYWLRNMVQEMNAICTTEVVISEHVNCHVYNVLVFVLKWSLLQMLFI